RWGGGRGGGGGPALLGRATDGAVHRPEPHHHRGRARAQATRAPAPRRSHRVRRRPARRPAGSAGVGGRPGPLGGGLHGGATPAQAAGRRRQPAAARGDPHPAGGSGVGRDPPGMILACGEALVDMVATRFGEGEGYVARPGGSPCNVAVGLARLAVPVGFLGRLSTDPFGGLIRDHLRDNGVDTRYVREGPEHTTLGFIHDARSAEVEYSFYV